MGFKNLRKNILYFSFFVFSLSLFFFSIPKILAQNTEGLTISPPITELRLKEGEVSSKNIKLTNPTNRVIEVYPRVMDFRAKGEGGEPAFFEAGDEGTRFSLSKWISFTQTKVALTPHQVVDFKYELKVPVSAEPGGHYGVLFFATEPQKNEEGSSNVALSSMVGSLILVKVPGEVSESANLESFTTKSFFNLNNNISFLTRVQNSGNIHVKPRGEIVIKSIFGSEVDRVTVNEQGGNVLPESTRKFENEWKSGKFLLGLYNAKVHLVYGDTGKVLDKSLSFIVIPWWIVVIKIIILIIITVLVIRWIIKRRKKKSQKLNGLDGGKVILR